MEKIKFYIGDENRVFEETDIQKSQLFKEQYAQLCERIADYNKINSQALSTKLSANAYGNIFVINGERGAGKTSVLTSLRNYLINVSNNTNPHLKCGSYLAPEIIDPSFFHSNANILQIIIAELFRNFQIYKDSYDVAIETQNKIINIFEKIKHALVVLDNSKRENWDDDIESLVDMSDAVNLREYIANCIGEILKLHKKELMLISIDDIDLNTEHAYRMLEQLRKYLTLPNVVIIMATKMEQLRQILEKHFTEEFSIMIDKGKMMKYENISEISSRYLLKIIPLENIVNLNNAKAILDKPITIVLPNQKELEENSTELLVLKLIWEKTGYMFLKRPSGFNFSVPRNLRELRFFIKFLVNMPNGEENKNQNRSQYQEYFKNEWIEENLLNVDKEKVIALFYVDDIQTLNKKIIDTILPKGKTLFSSPSNEIIDEENKIYNVSLGDVMTIIINLQETATDEQQMKFLHAVKTIYTFYLEENYQKLLTDSELKNKKIVNLSLKGVEGMLSGYQRLVGGALLNSVGFENILPNSTPRLSRMHHIVNLGVAENNELLRLLAMVYSGDKERNPMEEYRKRNERYYSRSLYQVKKFIIDWLYLLYSIPFYMEQNYRFCEGPIPENFLSGQIINNVAHRLGVDVEEMENDDNNQALTNLKKWFEGTCIHSIDVLEKIYQRLQEHVFKFDSSKPLEIYKALIKEVSSVSFDYIEKETLEKSAPIVFGGMLDNLDIPNEYVTNYIEPLVVSNDNNANNDLRPTRPNLSLMKVASIMQMRNVQDVINRLAHINARYRFSREWIENQVDALDLPADLFDGTERNARIIHQRLKSIR